MTASLTEFLPSWFTRTVEDLQPTPGRLNAALRIVLATILTLILVLVLQMPFASLGLYVVFFVARDTPGSSLRSGLTIILVIMFTVALELGVVILSDNDPFVRLISVAVVTFCAGIVMAAGTAPFLGAASGFVYVSVIALWETALPADTLVKLSLWLIATLSVAIGCSVAVEYTFGLRDVADRLDDQRRARYAALEALFRLYAKGAAPAQIGAASVRVARLGAAGQAGMQELYNTIVERDLDPGRLRIGARVRITMLAQLVDVSAAFASHNPSLDDPALCERCGRIADRCHELLTGQHSTAVEPFSESTAQQGLLDRVEAALHALLSMPEQTGDAEEDRELAAVPSKKLPFFVPGALKQPAVAGFALKISLCATLCYIACHALGWPGISTATVTVLLTAAGHTGAIKQKLMYRLLGSAVGGLLFGIGCTAFVFPRMDSIFSLTLLVGAVAFIAAWWAGGRRLSYVGLQIAFSFYLVAFEGAKAPTDLTPPRDRLAGILVALLVMWFVFDQLWPTRTITAMRRTLAGILGAEAKMFRVFEPAKSRAAMLREVDALRDQVGKAVASLRTMNDAAQFEYGQDLGLTIQAGDTILQAALSAVGLFWNQIAVLHREQDKDFLDEPRLIVLRQSIADRMDALSVAVARKLPAPVIDLASLADPELFEHPRYGDYTRNAVNRFGELQTTLAGLGVAI